MIETILAAVDGSESSLAGLQVASEWAAQLEAMLHAVFVEDESRFSTYTAAASLVEASIVSIPLPPDRMEAEKRRVAAESSAIRSAFELATVGKVPKARFSSIAGQINAVLIDAARGADLVVVGNRGRFEPRGSPRISPTTETLIRDAVRPVLIVPKGAQAQGPIVIAYDNGRGVQRILPCAAELALRLARAAIVVTVDSNAERARAIQAAVKPYLEAHGAPAKYVTTQGKPGEAILHAAKKEGAGLIAMGAFERNPIYELFFGSATLTVLDRAVCPLLLMA